MQFAPINPACVAEMTRTANVPVTEAIGVAEPARVPAVCGGMAAYYRALREEQLADAAAREALAAAKTLAKASTQ